MSRRGQSIKSILLISAAASAIAASSAFAGGLAVREQSTSSQGASFAGSAAGGDISSMFWNPAAIGIAGVGVTTQSSYSLILPKTEISGTVSGPPALAGAIGLINATSSTNTSTTDRPALVGATYGAYRLNDKLVLGVSLNSPFGTSNEPDDHLYSGRLNHEGAKLFTFNAMPTLAYEVTPGLNVAAGVQLQYARLKFQFAGSGTTPDPKISDIDVHDSLGVGFTLGLLWKPAPGTSIGLGFRSSVHHELEGLLETVTKGVGPVSMAVDLPEMVTLSLSQAVAPGWRALGTVEWTNWSRLSSIPVVGTQAVLGDPIDGTPAGDRVLDPHWRDGWLFAAGLEHDYSKQLTLRTGVAYEISPSDNPSFRLLQVPDSNRWWVSGGATYHWSASTSFDLGYSHVFLQDAALNRGTLANPGIVFNGEAKQSADIISVGMTTRW